MSFGNPLTFRSQKNIGSLSALPAGEFSMIKIRWATLVKRNPRNLNFKF